MDNGTADPDTWCNCGGECVPQGVLNISACRYGAPGFVSYPHFLDADPIFSQKIKGMSPNPEKHRMYVTLEPVSQPVTLLMRVLFADLHSSLLVGW